MVGVCVFSVFSLDTWRVCWVIFFFAVFVLFFFFFLVSGFSVCLFFFVVVFCVSLVFLCCYSLFVVGLELLMIILGIHFSGLNGFWWLVWLLGLFECCAFLV